MTGRYARVSLSGRTLVKHRLFWLRHRVASLVQATIGRLWPNAQDTGGGYLLHREWGWWTLRPAGGLRSWRYVGRPPYRTRAIPAGDRELAIEWAEEQLHLRT